MLSAELFSHHSPFSNPTCRGQKQKTRKIEGTPPWAMKMRLTLPAVLLLEHPRRQLPEESDESPRRGGDGFVSRPLVLRQILQQIRVHHQRTPGVREKKRRRRRQRDGQRREKRERRRDVRRKSKGVLFMDLFPAPPRVVAGVEQQTGSPRGGRTFFGVNY